ncbi:hypothetical protein C2E23DRAFT_93895 [Lenzites betulinus]|nr:hypothetical protein C2E23DRAFT_93895 [Lenzites betulinus]
MGIYMFAIFVVVCSFPSRFLSTVTSGGSILVDAPNGAGRPVAGLGYAHLFCVCGRAICLRPLRLGHDSIPLTCTGCRCTPLLSIACHVTLLSSSPLFQLLASSLSRTSLAGRAVSCPWRLSSLRRSRLGMPLLVRAYAPARRVHRWVGIHTVWASARMQASTRVWASTHAQASVRIRVSYRVGPLAPGHTLLSGRASAFVAASYFVCRITY